MMQFKRVGTSDKYKENFDIFDDMHSKISVDSEMESAMEAFLKKGGKVTKLKTRAPDQGALFNRGTTAK